MPDVKIRNVWAGVCDQTIGSMLVTRTGWGIFSRRSHLNSAGKPKHFHATRWDAERTAAALQRRDANGPVFEAYRCIFCDGYHVGRNR